MTSLAQPTYRYTADKAARALWAPLPVPWDGLLCTRPPGGAWHMNAVVIFNMLRAALIQYHQWAMVPEAVCRS